MSPSETDAQLAGRVAVVTGGTQGLGEAIARLFAARGAAGLVICGRNAARGNAIAEELSAAGCPTRYQQADLARVEDCRAVVAAADSAFGKVHALVNAAAITDRGTILDTTPELFDRMMAINLRAPFFLMQDAAKLMRREGIAGTVVNILSMSSHGGQPFIAAYSASKAALANLTRNTAFAL
ncbi:MAG TPA: oxidoreductase, partial [Kiloniellales bacterium]|nr:oxidoreductase [Kiloniellales bacterium]